MLEDLAWPTKATLALGMRSCSSLSGWQSAIPDAPFNSNSVPDAVAAITLLETPARDAGVRIILGRQLLSHNCLGKLRCS